MFLKQHGLRLSRENSQICVNSVKHLRYDLNSNGICVNMNIVKPITLFISPKCKIELHSVSEMITYQSHVH